MAHFGLRLQAWIMLQPERLHLRARAVLEFTHIHEGEGVFRDVLPLPVPTGTVADTEFAGTDETAVQAWLWIVVTALNCMWCETKMQKVPRQPTGIQGDVLHDLRQRILHFISLPGSIIPAKDWAHVMKQTALGYDGEVVKKARDLTWAQMDAALPAKEHCGRVDLLTLCEGPMREFVANPELSMRPLDLQGMRPKPGKFRATEEEAYTIARGLMSRGLLTEVPDADIINFADGPLVNGTFGVGKGSWPDGQPQSDDNEVLRWIVNLTASNELQLKVDGDAPKLPMAVQWRLIQLREEEYLIWSWKDLKGCFHIFRLPATWLKLFVLNKQFNRKSLGLSGSGTCFLGVTVVPMGWINAFGLVQYAHRRMLIVGTGGPTDYPRMSGSKEERKPGLPVDREIRKDKTFPLLDSSVEGMDDLWQVYCDDFDEVEICQGNEEVTELQKGIGAFQQAATAAYRWWDAPTSDHKSGDRQLQADRLGLRIDGHAGRLSHTGQRCGNLLGLTCHILQKPLVSARELQIAAGHWTHAIELKRETASVFSQIWPDIVRRSILPPRPLFPAVRREFVMAMALLPLMQADLRLTVDPRITVSDASETGGGVCVATGLTTEGVAAFRRELATKTAVGRDEIGLISGFEGIGGDRRAFDLLGVEIAGHLTIEIDERARRVTAAAWPGAEVHIDIKAVTKEVIRLWIRQHPHLRYIYVAGGSPCQGVTGLNAGARGMADPRTMLVYDLVQVYGWTVELAPHAEVDLLVENVASMDRHGPETVAAFNALMGSVPSDIEAADSGDMRRLRRYWHTWTIQETPEASITPGEYSNRIVLRGESPGHVRAFGGAAERKPEHAGAPFATFVRAIPRKAPPPSPRGIEKCEPEALARWRKHEFRYPPYQYRDGNGVWDAKGWRPLSAEERERRMGYESGHTLAALTKDELRREPQKAEDIRCALVGNSFYVPAVAWLIGQRLAQVGVLECIPSMAQCWGQPPDEALAELDKRLSSGSARADALAEEVIKHVHRNSSGRGSDVRLATGILFNPGAWPRRAVAAARWTWKVVVAFPMQGRHINVQELEAILSSLKWRTRTRAGPGRRSIHFVDSQVCMAVVAKGRSSSSQISQVLVRINALILASNLAPAMLYVKSADNPADHPSRWKKWGAVRGR